MVIKTNLWGFLVRSPSHTSMINIQKRARGREAIRFYKFSLLFSSSLLELEIRRREDEYRFTSK